MVIAFWHFGFDGYYFYDDMDYARYAYQMSQHNFHLDSSLFSHRIALIYVTALFYKIFGYSDISTNLPPLCWTLLTLNVLFFCLYRRNHWIALLATMLFSFDFYTIFFSNKLYPDGLVCTFTFIAAYLLWLVRRKKDTMAWGYAIAFTGALWVAFLAKVTVFYTLPFFAGVFFFDMVKKNNMMFWRAASFTFFLVLAVTGTYYYLHFGSIFYRFETIFAGHYVSADSYFDKGLIPLLERLTYKPFIMFISSGLAIVMIVALPALIGYHKGKWFRYADEEKYWVIYVLSILVFFWFGSTSLLYYNPIALFARHLLLIVPPLAILGGYHLYKLTENAIVYAVLFAMVTVVSFIIGLGNISYLYFLLTFFFMAYMPQNPLKLKYFPKETGYIIFLFILLIHPVYNMLKPTKTNYHNMKEALAERSNQLQQALVISDRQTCTCFPHFFDYQLKPACIGIDDPRLSKEMESYDMIYLLVFDYLILPAEKAKSEHLLNTKEFRLNKIIEKKGFQLYQIAQPPKANLLDVY